MNDLMIGGTRLIFSQHAEVHRKQKWWERLIRKKKHPVIISVGGALILHTSWKDKIESLSLTEPKEG